MVAEEGSLRVEKRFCVAKRRRGTSLATTTITRSRTAVAVCALRE